MVKRKEKEHRAKVLKRAEAKKKVAGLPDEEKKMVEEIRGLSKLNKAKVKLIQKDVTDFENYRADGLNQIKAEIENLHIERSHLDPSVSEEYKRMKEIDVRLEILKEMPEKLDQEYNQIVNKAEDEKRKIFEKERLKKEAYPE